MTNILLFYFIIQIRIPISFFANAYNVHNDITKDYFYDNNY